MTNSLERNKTIIYDYCGKKFMVKNVAALEICSEKVKFAVGYSIHKKPHLLYYSEKPLPAGSVFQGEIKNEEAVSKVLRSLTSFDDETLRLKVDTDEISLILPALGFEVYDANKSTNVVSPECIVNELDINNVMSLVRKEAIPSGNTVVDIIPNFFMTSSMECYENPPLQKPSSSIAIQAQIHTLPDRIISSYQRTTQSADFRVRRSIVSPFCTSELIKSDESFPKDYLLLDMGEDLSTLSLVGNNRPYGSVLFPLGGRKLSESLANGLNLSFPDAEALKKKYGYNLRQRVFRTTLSIKEKDFPKESVSQERINSSMVAYFENFDRLLVNAIESLSRKCKTEILKSLPIVYTGGASSLYGLEGLLKKGLPNSTLLHFVPKVIGGRDPSMSNILGAIATSGEYHGTLEDHYHGVSALTREKETNNVR